MTARREYAHMSVDDMRSLAMAIDDIYHQPSWQPSKQHKRVLMLLGMFSMLEKPDDGAYPTFPLSVAKIANRAGVRNYFACGFVAWLTREGYLVEVAPDVAAFGWHVAEARRGRDGGEHADA